MNRIINLLLRHRLCFLDTSCFIYLLENNKNYADLMNVVFDYISLEKLKAASSIISISEVLVKPFKENKQSIVNEYVDFFLKLPSFTIIYPDIKEAIKAAEIRAKFNFELVDSYQLALAQLSGCKTFLTNDKNLKKYKEIKVLILEDFVNKSGENTNKAQQEDEKNLKRIKPVFKTVRKRVWNKSKSF